MQCRKAVCLKGKSPKVIKENVFKNPVSLCPDLTGSSTVSGMALAWQQLTAILIKRFHHSRRDWKGLISQLLLPVLFVVFAMGLGSIKSDLRHYPKMELSPALYKFDPSYAFFRLVQQPGGGFAAREQRRLMWALWQ